MYDEKEIRKIHINSNNHNKFCSNVIKTAKYNWFTFLPLAIAYQFNNYFNIFFLFTAVILAIKVISPMDPGTAIGPFIIVLLIGVVKEAVEDYKKKKFDKTYNNSTTTRIKLSTSQEEEAKWSQIKVGDVLKIKKNEVIPADLLVIKSSLPNGFCYMQTTNLDGESALKPREALHIFKTVLNFNEDNEQIIGNNEKINGLNNFNEYEGGIEVDEPNSNIYKINGKISFWRKNASANLEYSIKNSFFTIDNVLLRGTTLKNVDHVFGLVLYTGRDTKIMKNIQKNSIKASSIEKTLNKVIIVVIIIVCSMCVACTIFGIIYTSTNIPNLSKGDIGADYVYYEKSKFQYHLEFFQLFGAFFIIFNNIIPISLTVTFEIAKTIQVLYMQQDKNMFNELEGENFKCLSLKLQEDLGNVKYIFTDKTGTLTKNEMIFRGCSIYSKLFFNVEEIKKFNEEDEVVRESNITAVHGRKIFSNLFNLDEIKFYLHSELPIEIENIDISYYKSARDVVIEFFLNMALNHNVLTEKDEKSGSAIFQGTNPDEVALVTAAKEIGIEYIQRVGPIITVGIDNNPYSFEVLHKFEFSSERARSSIIVKDLQTSEIKLFIKGSDEKIMALLDIFSKYNLEATTRSHLDLFAKNGLRTLCYGIKVIDEVSYLKWNEEFKQIKSDLLSNPSKAPEYEKKISEIEKNCILLGVSGLEDKLQEEVKETIQEFIDAGIQIWMITGDKLDTAESIGYSSKLFDEHTEIFKIKSGLTKDEIEKTMKNILEEMTAIEEELLKLKLERKRKKKKKKTVEDGHVYIHDRNDIELKFKKEMANPRDNLGYVRSLSEVHPEMAFHRKEKSSCPENEDIIKIKTFNTPKNYFRSLQKYPLNFTPGFGAEMEKEKNRDDNRIKTLIINRKNSGNGINHINIIEDNNYDLIRARSNIIKNNEDYSDGINKSNGSIPQIDQFELDSEADDISIFKFMMDRNFFETSFMNKKEFAHTFVNKIIQLAGHENIISIDSIQNNTYKAKEDEKDENQILDKDNIKIHIKRNEEVEEVDIADIYDFYVGELNKLKKRKDDVRRFLKFTNLDFHNKKDKKPEQEIDNTEFKLLNFGLIIEGAAITTCLSDDLKATFWKLIKKASAIICCRCSPIQKSDIVSFVKDKSGDVCLAIGDGGNDVNMIKAANLGVGIFGKEGYQAAYSSDYAISQFKYLKRLLFCHGRYFLRRNSYFVYFFFYKSLIFNVPNLWFAFFSGFSGTLIWDNLYFVCYNSILTTMPPVVYMVYDEDFDYEFEKQPNKEVLKNLIPDIYKEYRESSPFNSLKFFIVFMLGIMHSSIIYFLPVFVFKYGIQDDTGRTNTLWDQSMAGVLTVLIVQYYIIFEDTFLYFFPVFIAHSVQILHNIIFFVVYGALGNDQLGAFTFDVVSNFQFWFTLILTITIELVPIIMSRKVDNLFLNNIINNLRNGNYEEDCLKKIYTKKIEHMSRCTRSIFKFKKFLHQNKEYEPENYVDKKMMDFVELYKNNKKSEKNNNFNQFNTRYTRARSVDVKSNFFKTLQSINHKIRNNKRKFSLRDKEKELNQTDVLKVKNEFRSNSEKDDIPEEMVQNKCVIQEKDIEITKI